MQKILNKQTIFGLLGKEKMKKAKQVFKEEGLRIIYKKSFMPCEYRDPTMFRSILIMKGETEVAHFDLSGECPNGSDDCFLKTGESDINSTIGMSIGIDDDIYPQLIGIQLSRIMMWAAMTELLKEGADMQQYVYIDTDASAGFWQAIGMTVNETARGEIGAKGHGYEKKIRLDDISSWCRKI